MAVKVAYLSLGSNLGHREESLRAAIARLHAPDFRVTRISGIVESAPMYVENQPAFLNLVIEVETTTFPMQALQRIARVERDLGRRRLLKNGPRSIDIDIVLFGKFVLNTPQLVIPHPRMAERRFVLEPLAELAPSLRHPVTHMSAKEMLAAVSDQFLRPYPARIALPVLVGEM